MISQRQATRTRIIVRVLQSRITLDPGLGLRVKDYRYFRAGVVCPGNLSADLLSPTTHIRQPHSRTRLVRTISAKTVAVILDPHSPPAPAVHRRKAKQNATRLCVTRRIVEGF